MINYLLSDANLMSRYSDISERGTTYLYVCSRTWNFKLVSILWKLVRDKKNVKTAILKIIIFVTTVGL